MVLGCAVQGLTVVAGTLLAAATSSVVAGVVSSADVECTVAGSCEAPLPNLASLVQGGGWGHSVSSAGSTTAAAASYVVAVVVAAGYSDSSCHKGTPAGLQTES